MFNFAQNEKSLTQRRAEYESGIMGILLAQVATDIVAGTPREVASGVMYNIVKGRNPHVNAEDVRQAVEGEIDSAIAAHEKATKAA